MAFGLGRLRLSPDAFWAMTPRELAAAAQPFVTGTAPPGRDEFARLLACYPDEVRHGR